MKMSALLKTSLGSALFNILGTYGDAYVFVTGDTRSLSDINTALAASNVSPSTAGLTSLTGTTLKHIGTSNPVVGTSTITVTSKLTEPMTVKTAGTATYLVVCSSSSITSGVVYAVLPIAATNAPVIMASPAVSVDDVVALPALTFTVPIS